MELFNDLKKILSEKKEHYISREEINVIYKHFELARKNISELKMIRNTVVEELTKVLDLDNENFRLAMDYMSAVTSVIDNEIWEKGGAV